VFAAVAERVFYADAPAYFALALRTAVEKDFASRFRSEQVELEDVEESEAADDETGEEQPAEAATRSRDTRPTHPSRRAEEDDVPEPEPFKPDETRRSSQPSSSEDQGQAKLSTARKTPSPRSEDPVERAAIQKFKVPRFPLGIVGRAWPEVTLPRWRLPAATPHGRVTEGPLCTRRCDGELAPPDDSAHGYALVWSDTRRESVLVRKRFASRILALIVARRYP
jgi:hypothetical protein